MIRSIILSIFILTISFSQSFAAGIIYGNVKSAEEETPLRGATVMIVGEMLGSRTDNDGNFKIENLEPGN
jgi:hypothetical protein